MENLWIAVYLIDSSKVVVIPIKFIYNLSLSKSFNNRINRNQPHLIFWSANHQDQPNFHLTISKAFDQNDEACYYANLLKAFGKKKEKVN